MPGTGSSARFTSSALTPFSWDEADRVDEAGEAERLRLPLVEIRVDAERIRVQAGDLDFPLGGTER
jgi:hypothetical protein